MSLTSRVAGKERIRPIHKAPAAKRPPFSTKPPDSNNAIPVLDLNIVLKDENEKPRTVRKLGMNRPRSARFAPTKAKASAPSTTRAVSNANPLVPNGPITPIEARAKYSSLLTSYEQTEIDSFQEIYYIGQKSKKIRPNKSGESNYGYDDIGFHYKARIGDHIAFRFEIRAILGKGSFGQVIKCIDHKNNTTVALKMIVNTKQMHEQGEREIAIIQHLNAVEGCEESHVIQGLDFFLFRNHICVTFPPLGKNLYEYSRSLHFRPLTIRQIKSITRDVLNALDFCHDHGVVHCDMKPENILLIPNSTQNIKLIDFGSSCMVGHQIFEYIQSRYYRAPEVILGIKYGPPMDIWSYACIIVELMIGKPLFPGDDESEVLDMMMEVLGLPPDEFIQRGSRKKYFFNESGKPLPNPKRRRRRIGSSSIKAAIKTQDEQLIDFISKCLVWVPEQRMTAREALNHPWLQKKNPTPKKKV